MGRSEVSAVAQRRKMDIELFLNTLFSLRDEVAHSDIVYTFLHPLLRDQEDTDIHITKLKKPGLLLFLGSPYISLCLTIFIHT